MQYGVVGASYQQGSLAVFHAGLDDEPLATYAQATQKALHLLVNELSASTLGDIHALLDQVMTFLAAGKCDVVQLDAATADTLTLSWFDDDHYVINVMDQTEAYQLHIEVVPAFVDGGHPSEA
ncbi:hypothetical protein ACFQ5J_00955 [Lacticaseibacillus baoqingensis]|uniref:Uncharacterized protein n=1 Tax=Lacticaseibacillus baoqingensis TaxID=2486013 RepID=A0ABW4E5Q3_9LACO|nr:hypothetical protein [Lacticaseibacillus baoqingensis]